MFEKIKKSRITKIIASYIVISMFFGIAYPTAAFALTGGPSQPEVQSFEPVGTSEMVDISSGDFTYNIPLMDVGGYPINISYHSGINMDQESSWVGLGWNINAGAITRNMRGIPDDFKGDEVIKENSMKPNRTFGVSAGISGEILGLSARAGLGIRYNNYTGLAMETSINATAQFNSSKMPGNASLGLGLTSSSDGGLSISPNVSFSTTLKENTFSDVKGSLSIGTSFNSRQGVRSLNLGMGISESQNIVIHKDDNGNETAYEMLDASNKRGLGDMNGGASISFGATSYTPMISNSFKNFTANLSVKLGGTFVGFDGTFDIAGYYSQQVLATTKENVPAYGYLYSDQKTSKNVLMDFNREKESSFSENTPSLPLTSYTYDIYSVTGQGVGGMYRPFRGDLGHVFDKTGTNTSSSINLGVDLKGGNAVQGGADITVANVNSVSGDWTRNNSASRVFNFTKKSKGSDFEPYYFKQAGEKSVDIDNTLFENIGGFDPVRFNFGDVMGFDVELSNKLVKSYGASSKTISSSNNKRTQRVRRNQVITFLTSGDYQDYAIDKSYYSDFSNNSKDHHIAEITTIRPDGVRYVYGLPAYITHHDEVTFNVSGRNVESDSALVSYIPNTDDCDENKNGIDHYFNKSSMPAYAHSYMLTAVLSNDYVDVNNNGPDADDYGSYTLFTYERVQDYNWRVPYKKNTANYSEGLKTIRSDDKGNYLFGTKDLYYLKTIETKNYSATFSFEDRADGKGVMDKDGGANNSKSTKLIKKISLYANGIGVSPKLIKEVHFEYDYSLCKGVDNNDMGQSSSGCQKTNVGGKLTLKKIYFTYGNSYKAKYNKYEFHYDGENPDYNIKGYDRWGSYKDAADNGSYISNADFPYTIQDKTIDNNGKTLADRNTAAWSLTKIDLPSGGEISIEYESDSYAYVQDRKAMQMFDIIGIRSSKTPGTTNSGSLNKTGDTYVIVSLPASYSDADFVNDFLDFNSEMYFRILAKVNNSSVNDGFEYVSGYCDIDKSNSGIDSDGNGYIKLINSTSSYDNPVTNPMAKAAIQFGRLNTPKQAYDDISTDADANDVDVVTVINAILGSSFSKNISEMIVGPNSFLYNKGLGNRIKLNRSWVRLNNPSGEKYGGGVRVKKIELLDNWSAMGAGTSAMDATTGQEYNYTTVREDGKVISSGVAQYEPMVGADENPFRVPVAMGDNRAFLAPNDRYYMEEPFGESFFPSPSIIYSRVTVNNIKYDGTSGTILRHATGKVVHEFYTAKDFPVRTMRTDLALAQKKSNILGNFLKLDIKDYMHATQGFSIVLNDMHGKQKAQWVYAEGQSKPISGVEYFYKQKRYDDKTWDLSNDATVIEKSGAISSKQIGVDYDIIADFREQKTDAKNIGVSANLYAMTVGIPIVLPPILPSYSRERTRFQSASVTKVINRYGILEKTVAYDLGSRVSVDNLAWDASTGEVLLTHTTNDFNDDVYSFTYPAHWAYDRMGMAYRNIDYEFSITAIDNSNPDYSVLSILNAGSYFVKGDEIGVEDNGVKKRVWVIAVNPTNIHVVGFSGNQLSSTSVSSGKILRSGRRNMQTIPVGSVNSANNPLDSDGDGVIDNNLAAISVNSKILSASATEFSDDWDLPCDCTPQSPEFESDITNDYILARFGIWRQKKVHTFLTTRSKTGTQGKIRNDGFYNAFSEFWNNSNSNSIDWTKNEDGWTWVSEVTKYSPFSFELENKDALERYSSALYGYHNRLPIAVASNARYIEIGFEGFEYAKDCVEGAFNFTATRTNVESHTGVMSLIVATGSSVSSGTYATTPLDATGKVNEQDCIGAFNLIQGKKYIVSGWVKVSNSLSATNYSNVFIKVHGTIVGTSSFYTMGRIIDGWQRIEGSFIVRTLQGGTISVELYGDPNEDTYFDDIRVFPFDGNMKSYVYDSKNYRFLAELDNNNYATFYEYDEDGALVRVKKETERGIMTIKESRNFKTK